MATDTVTGKVYQVDVVTPYGSVPRLTFDIVRLVPNPSSDITDRWDKEGFSALKQDGYFFGPFGDGGDYQGCFYRCPNKYSITFRDLSGKKYVYTIDKNRTPVERMSPPADEEKLLELQSDTGCWFDKFYEHTYPRLVDPWFQFLSTGAWPKETHFQKMLDEEEKAYYLDRDLKAGPY